jgi:histidinol phosphatase-like enzyme
MYRAAFIDVDGVIRHNNQSKEGAPYYNMNIEEIEFIDGALEAHRLLYENNIPVFWVTMQNCILEGLISYSETMSIFAFMINEVEKYGGRVQDVFICTTLTEDKKAKAYVKYESIIKPSDVYLSNSFAAGDANSDILAYLWVGIGNIYHIKIPYGDTIDLDMHPKVNECFMASNLLEAVKSYIGTYEAIR